LMETQEEPEGLWPH